MYYGPNSKILNYPILIMTFLHALHPSWHLQSLSTNRWISLMIISLTRLIYDILVILHVMTLYFSGSSLWFASQKFAVLSFEHRHWVRQLWYWKLWDVWRVADHLLDQCFHGNNIYVILKASKSNSPVSLLWCLPVANRQHSYVCL